MPLAISVSDIFSTIFITFIGLVTLGIGHGLILLPVVLSLVGPEVCVRKEKPSSKKSVPETLKDTGENLADQEEFTD